MEKISIWHKIKEDFCVPKQNDPAFNSWLEIFFNYPGVWAIVNYRVANFFYKSGFKLIGRMIMGVTQILTSVDLHPAATIGRRVFLDHAAGIVIGETAQIGDDALIYQGVTIGGVSLEKGVKRHPTIENGVVIGSGAKILGNIIIGENSRIGSNSVVIKNVPRNSTAVGIPASVVDKEAEKTQFEHNKIPDINKELFVYLFKRIEALENAISKQNIDIEKDFREKDDKLELIYKKFIKSIKE